MPTLYVGLEVKTTGDLRIDGLVHLENHIVVLIENQMSDSVNYQQDGDRVKNALNHTLSVKDYDFDPTPVKGRYGLIFDFIKNKAQHQGRPAMHWLMHRTGSWPLLHPIVLPMSRFRQEGVNKTKPLIDQIKDEDFNKDKFCLESSKQFLLRNFSFLSTSIDEVEIHNKVYIEQSKYEWKIKHLIAMPKPGAVLGLDKLAVAPVEDENALPRDCVLCAAPLVRADDPSTSLTLLELQTQARRQVPRERVYALASRGRAVRLPWGSARACLPCAALLEDNNVQGALQASVEIFPADDTILAQEIVVKDFDQRVQSDLVVTEVHGEALRFHIEKIQSQTRKYERPSKTLNNTSRDLLKECQQNLENRGLSVQYRQFSPEQHWVIDRGQVWQCVGVANLPPWGELRRMSADISSADDAQVHDIFMRKGSRDKNKIYWITHVNEDHVYFEQLYPLDQYAQAEDKKILDSTVPVSSVYFKVKEVNDEDFVLLCTLTSKTYTIKHVSRIGVAGIRSRELRVHETIEMPVRIQNDGAPNSRGTFLEIDSTREFLRYRPSMRNYCKFVSHKRLRQKYVQFLFNNIHDITHSILERPGDKPWHTALYVAVGALPALRALKQSEENYVGSVLRASAADAQNVPRTLTAARYWRVSGCAAWLWMRGYNQVYGAMRLDVFLHFVWDNHVLQEEQRFEDGGDYELKFQRIVSRDNFQQVPRDVVRFLRRNNNKIPAERWIAFDMAGVLPGDFIGTAEAERFQLKVPWWIVQWHLALLPDAGMTEERATCMVRAACKDAGQKVQQVTEVPNPPSAASEDSAWRRAESQLDVETGSQFARGRAGMVLQAAAAVVGEFAQAGAVEALREYVWLSVGGGDV